MTPSQVSFRLRAVAKAVESARRPDPVKVAALLSRVAEEVPQTQRSPRLDDWQDVDLDVDEDESPPTTRSPDLKVRGKQFVSDMEAGVLALKGIVQSGPEGRESDIRGALELVTKGAEGLQSLL